MNVKIYMYMYKCNVYDNSNKRIKFNLNDFLYMYYLISKYGVGGWGGIWQQIITKIQFLRIVRIDSLI